MRKRISLLVAAGLMAVGLAAAPANAADPVFTLVGPAQVGLHPHPGSGEGEKTRVLFMINNETGQHFDSESTFSLDLSPLKGVADVAFEDGGGDYCTLTATSLTCKTRRFQPGVSSFVQLGFSAAKGSKVGATADVTMTGKAEGATFKAATTKIRVGGPDVVVQKAPLNKNMKPGATQPLPIVFSNAGTDPSRGVVLELNTTHGIGFVEKYDNCRYSEGGTPEWPWNLSPSKVLCTLDGEFEPGGIYEITGALTLKAAPHGFVDGLTYAVHAAGDEPKPAQKATTPATGKTLTVGKREAKAAPRSADLDVWNNRHVVDVLVKNTADFVAVGASLKGKAGETVTAELGLRNDGPAWVANIRLDSEATWADIVIPAGVKVTKASEECRGAAADGSRRDGHLGAPRYFCLMPKLIREQEKVTYPFDLEIEEVVAEATGSVTVGKLAEGARGTNPQKWDPNHANDKASVVINGKDVVPAPTPTPTPAPSTSTGTGTGTPAPGTSATAPAAGNNGTPNGGLASTGSTAGPIAIGGAALVAAGGVLFLVFRRRRAAAGA